MARTLTRVCASTTITVLVWYFLLLVAGYLASFGDAWLNEGRIWPYSHAHLGEEYAEGNYLPLLDPLFIFSAIARDCISFFLGATFLLRATPSWLWLAIYVTLTSLLLYALQFRFHFPYIIQAFAIEATLILVGAAVGKHIAISHAQKTAS